MPEIRPYQRTGAAHLANAARKGALLADEMRLGKCAQAIKACEIVHAHFVTVICPASVVETWRREFKKWSEYSFELEVWSYDMANRGHANRWCGSDVLILDEAHALKNTKAKRTQLIYGAKCDGVEGLIAQANNVFLLTGTPMPNNPAELYPSLRALHPVLNPKSGKPYSYWQFVNKFCKTRDNGFGLQIVGAKNHEALAAHLKGFMLRRTMAEVKPEVPAIQFDDLFLEAGVDAAGVLATHPDVERVRRALREGGVEALATIAGHVATLRRLTGLAKVAPVVAWAKDWLEAGGEKIVLFAHHKEVIDALFHGFNNVIVGRITGETTAKRRTEIIDWFQRPGVGILIGQLQAAGTGIDLSAAKEMIFVESSWVPSENAQAAARIVSLQEPEPRLVRFATLAGSIDEDIQRAVRRKSEDIVRIMG